MKVLYIAQEIQPFLKTTPQADVVRELAEHTRKESAEVRVSVPRFGVIHQRKNNIHEVLRLSGVNITVGDEDISLLIQVGSIRAARLQVYFVDNEELFGRKSVLHDKEGNFYPDNHTRAIFFCKGVLRTLEHLEWSPDIIHCHGWMSSLIPLYIRKTYHRSLLFKKAKCVYTMYDDTAPPMPNLAALADDRWIEEEDLAILKENSVEAMIKSAAKYADKVVHHFDDQEERKTTDAFLASLDAMHIPRGEQMCAKYSELYASLLKKS